jgi:hypothetical protein
MAGNRRMAENIADRRKRTKRKAKIYKTLHRKKNIEQHEPHKKWV